MLYSYFWKNRINTLIGISIFLNTYYENCLLCTCYNICACKTVSSRQRNAYMQYNNNSQFCNTLWMLEVRHLHYTGTWQMLPCNMHVRRIRQPVKYN